MGQLQYFNIKVLPSLSRSPISHVLLVTDTEDLKSEHTLCNV